MNLIFYALGVILIFVTKLLVNNKGDEPVEKWKRIFEVPTDMTLLGFMMGIAGTAALKSYTRGNQIAILFEIAAGIISVALYKKNCSTVSNVGGVVQFDKSWTAILIFVINISIAMISIYVSYSYLGANAS